MSLCLLVFSDCSTKKLLWTYSVRSEEEFILFCDLPEPQKSHFYQRNLLSPTQGTEHLPCSGSEDLSDVQWYLQPPNGDMLREIPKNHSHFILDQNTLRFLAMEVNNTGSYICTPRIRYVPNAFLPENIPKFCMIWTYIYVHRTLLTLLGGPGTRPVVLRWS